MSGGGTIYEYQRELTARLEQTMTENKKLRALLAEARGWVAYDTSNRRGCLELQERIDAALAEPVDDDRWELALGLMETASKHLGKRSNESLSEAAERVALERDEAKADARVFRERMDYLREDFESAYQRGAEAMRESAAQVCEEGYASSWDAHNCADAIAGLPIPEDKP